MTDIARELRNQLRLAEPADVESEKTALFVGEQYTRHTVNYEGLENDPISAYLFLPLSPASSAGVVIFHQHSGEFHFGKAKLRAKSAIRFRLLALLWQQRVSPFLLPTRSLLKTGAVRFPVLNPTIKIGTDTSTRWPTGLCMAIS